MIEAKKIMKIGVVGAGGRIGDELLKLIKQNASFEPTLGIGKKSAGFVFNASSFGEVKSTDIDVLIDFSSPKLFVDSLEFCKINKIPFISGTTGLSVDHQEMLKTAGSVIPLLWSPNMSLGIAALKKAMGVFKKTAHFDYQIEEWHHKNKKDSPSGTAIYLQNELESVIEKKCPPTMVMRAGSIFGVHKVYAVSEEEMIVFEHTALNRTVFARGALVAASWLLNQTKKGVYTMDDVIS